MFGKTYAVDSEDVLDDSWSVLSSNLTGTGSSRQVLDAGSATLAERFYRGVMLIP